MKKTIKRLLAILLAVLMTGVIQATAVFAAELVGVELGAAVIDGIVAGKQGEVVYFTINLYENGNLKADTNITVPTHYTLDSTGLHATSTTSNTPTILTTSTCTFITGNSNSKNLDAAVEIASSAVASTTPYSIKLDYSISNASASGLKDTTEDDLKVVVSSNDVTPPVLTLPSNITAEATSAAGTAVSFTASAADNVDPSVTVTCSQPSGSTFPLGTTTVNCSATDTHGNTATGSFTVTVQDTTGPDISLPVVSDTEAADSAGAVVTFTSPTATDVVDGNVPVTCEPVSGSTFPIGQTTVTCSATDSHGNTSEKSFIIIVKDTTAPVLVLPADITAEASGKDGAVVDFSASANDLVDGAVTVSCAPASGSIFNFGITTVNCTATDAHGNVVKGSFNITVQDTIAPAISNIPGNIIAEAAGSNGAVVTFATPVATDIVDGAVEVSCSPVSGSMFPLDQTTTVICTATDSHGNTATETFTVTVKDTTAPQIQSHDDMTVEATGPNGAIVNFIAPEAIDLVDGAVAVECTPASGSTFALGTNTVTYTSTDAHGNTATGSFSITVQDTTAPAISSVPGDIIAEADCSTGAAVTFVAPVATDIVDGPVEVSCSPASGSMFPLDQTITVTCTATDSHGNTATETFTVTVEDTTAPEIALHDDITVEATGPNGAIVNFAAPEAIDLVDGAVAVECTPASGSTFALGTNTVTYTSTDAHGNTATGSFTVTVQDTTAPVLTLPANIITYATGASGAVVTFQATAYDLVDGAVAVTCSPASGSTFAPGTTTVQCTATDAHGNTATGSFKVTVKYNFTGFFQPVDMGGVVNTAKAGSAIPVKFSLGGNMGLKVFAVGYPKVNAYDVKTGAVTAPIELTVTAGGSSLSYDSVAEQYIYVWKTEKNWAGSGKQLVIQFNDGSDPIVAYFQFK